jgi:hypothetical protein
VGDAVLEYLVLDFLQWLESHERTYEEVMSAWRTSCPRLPVWEEANDRGLVRTEYLAGFEYVRATSSGRALVAEREAPQRLVPD